MFYLYRNYYAPEALDFTIINTKLSYLSFLYDNSFICLRTSQFHL